MKKPIQNVLAQHSDGTIAYMCSKCGKIVEKEDTVCKHCGARLGNIKCPFCNFTGSIEDFKLDTCPKCGRKKPEARINITNKKKSKNTKNKEINNKLENNKYTTKKSNSTNISTSFFWLSLITLLVILFILILYNSKQLRI